MAESQNLISKKITLSYCERGDRRRRWVRVVEGERGVGKISFFPPLIHPDTGPFSHGEGFPSLFETADSATLGKPFVQNDMRVRSGIGRRIHVLLVFTVEEYSRQDK